MTYRYAFTADSRECWLDSPEPNRPFHNMLFNRSYFTMIDHTGCGAGRYLKAHAKGWYTSNIIKGERILYVRDDESGQFFSVGFWPTYRKLQSFRCGAGLGYQIIENQTLDLKVTWRIFVPAGDDPLEVWDVRVADASRRPRKVSLFTYGEMHCDGTDSYTGSLSRIARFYPQVNGVMVWQGSQTFEEIDFPLHNGFITADRPAVGADPNMRVFIGLRRTVINPLAVETGRCNGRHASMQTATISLHVPMQVQAGGQEDTRFLVGACFDEQTIRQRREKYLGGNLDGCAIFDALAADRAGMMANIQLRTPDASIDHMINVWAKQQIHFGATWCRWGWFGYRDIVQQTQGVLTQDAGLARAALLKSAAHQYNDGFALRGYNPIDPMRYADSAQWMISAVTEYIKETGDLAMAREVVPYFDGGQDSVYGHLLKAMERLHTDRGAHGLCLIFFGDWNDSLTAAGRKGKGESVWLSMAFCRDAILMAELAEQLGKAEDAKRMRAWHAEMAENLNKHAWDGQWYLCALDDDGKPIGSAGNEEGKIFLNMQSWAQLGKVADDGRFNTAWAACQKHLDSGWGLTLNWPTYTKPQANIGRLAYLRPGICENGSVYTHGNAFMFLALLERGQADEAWAVWQGVHPGNPKRPVANPPLVFVNGYFGPDNDIEVGRAEHMWVTGSAAWMFMAVVEFMLGLRRTYAGLVIRPCLPSSWEGAAITRVYRGSTYRVTMTKPKGKVGVKVKAITVDGKAHPVNEPLPMDGREHEVKVAVEG
ncbi:MAG: hypothetical protein IT443_01165 [Phycisphaeraceae bacterium]|nr:hypothetical protein [Phycisphaeraceae bacterium]